MQLNDAVAVKSTLKNTNQQTPIFNPSLAVEPLYYTVKQASTVMGYDSGTLHNWISAFELGKKKRLFVTAKVGGRRLILISSFNEFLAKRDEEESSSNDVELITKPRGRGRPRNRNTFKALIANQN